MTLSPLIASTWQFLFEYELIYLQKLSFVAFVVLVLYLGIWLGDRLSTTIGAHHPRLFAFMLFMRALGF
jgi:hypothetical protein